MEESSFAIQGNIDAGAEPSELPCSVGEGAESEKSSRIKCATADSAVACPGVENDVTVQQAHWSTERLVIENPGANPDLRKV